MDSSTFNSHPADLLSVGVKQQIKELAQRSPAEEICGWLDNQGGVHQVKNQAEDPKEDALFEVPGEAIATWHTHWDDHHPALHTFKDIQASKLSLQPSVVYHVGRDLWDLYDPLWWHPWPLRSRSMSPKDPASYLKWPWEWSRSDCWSLVVGWYRGMLGIPILDGPRLNDRAKVNQDEGWNRFIDEMPGHGFEELPPGEPLQRHDVIGMATQAEVVHHVGIVADPNSERTMMLHLLDRDRPSAVTRYILEYKHATLKRWRHPQAASREARASGAGVKQGLAARMAQGVR